MADPFFITSGQDFCLITIGLSNLVLVYEVKSSNSKWKCCFYWFLDQLTHTVPVVS